MNGNENINLKCLLPMSVSTNLQKTLLAHISDRTHFKFINPYVSDTNGRPRHSHSAFTPLQRLK